MEIKDEIRSLGEEKIPKLLLKFSIPCVMGLLISALYNIVDQIFIGNSSLGYLGNAATGVSFPVICIANAFAWCIGDGAASYLSICSGRQDADRAHKCVGTGITITTILSLVLAAVCLVFAEPLMRLFGASDQTADMAVEYFRIIATLFPCYLLMNVMNSMIRADGSPSYAMTAMLTGAIVNLILDPVFIYLLNWGIAGAAWATAIGQVASFLLCAVYFIHPKCFHLTWRSFLPDQQVLAEVVSLGASTFVTQISIVVMTLVCNMTLAHYGALSQYGQDIPISVFSIQTKVYTVVCNIVTGIVLGGQPIFGYNYGAGKLDRVRQTYRIVLLSSITVGLAATLVFQFRPEVVINLFGAGDELYMEFATKTFRVYLSLMVITCLVKMTAVFFQSIGKSVYAVVASLIRDIVCFTPIAIGLSAALEHWNAGSGINGILLAAPLADGVAAVVILCLVSRFFGHWAEKTVPIPNNTDIPLKTLSRRLEVFNRKIIMRRNSMIFYPENHRIDNTVRRCLSLSKKPFDKLPKFFKLSEKFEKLSLLNAKGNPDGSLSHYPSLRNAQLGRFFDSLNSIRPVEWPAGRRMVSNSAKPFLIFAVILVIPHKLELDSGRLLCYFTNGKKIFSSNDWLGRDRTPHRRRRGKQKLSGKRTGPRRCSVECETIRTPKVQPASPGISQVVQQRHKMFARTFCASFLCSKKEICI